MPTANDKCFILHKKLYISMQIHAFDTIRFIMAINALLILKYKIQNHLFLNYNIQTMIINYNIS